MDFTFELGDRVTIATTGESGEISYLQETERGPQYEVVRGDGSTVMVAEADLVAA